MRKIGFKISILTIEMQIYMAISPYLAIYSELSSVTYASFGGEGSHIGVMCSLSFIN